MCFVFEFRVVFEFWVLRFRDFVVFVFDLGCFVFEIRVLRASVFVFECFVFETHPCHLQSGVTPLEIYSWVLNILVWVEAGRAGGGFVWYKYYFFSNANHAIMHINGVRYFFTASLVRLFSIWLWIRPFPVGQELALLSSRCKESQFYSLPFG